MELVASSRISTGGFTAAARGNRKKLPLSLGQIASIPIEHGIISFWKLSDERIRICDSCSLFDLLIADLRTAVADIIRNGPCKEMGILNDHGEGTAQIILSDLPNIDSIVGDDSAVNLIKPV